MPLSRSKKSQKNNDSYYTTQEMSKEFWEVIANTINVNEIRLALEPAVGNGDLVKSAPTHISWITNDLYPEAGNQPDYQQDYLELELDKKVDLIITNPPFGKSSILAKNFLKTSFKLDPNYVAFIAPASFSKRTTVNQFYKYPYKLVLDQKPTSNEDFYFSEGGSKKVSVTFQIWEKSLDKKKSADLSNDYITHIKDKSVNVTNLYALRWWGQGSKENPIGTIKKATEVNYNLKGWELLDINPEIVELLKACNWGAYTIESSVSSPCIRVNTFIAEANRLLVKKGIKQPLANVDYETATRLDKHLV